jgi:hypothetical protein
MTDESESTAMPQRYKVVAPSRSGKARIHEYAADEPLRIGQVLRLEGRWWLVEGIEPTGDSPRVAVKPARYRIRLHHPDGREELGAFRRYRADAPRLGHSLSTVEDGQTASWQVVDERVELDDRGEPFLDLVAERDFAEVVEAPDHELEHALAARAQTLPEEASAALARAGTPDYVIELVALEPGELPDWDEARRYIDALVLDELEDDLPEQCGVEVERDPRETWIAIVQERLRNDLESFRADVEGDQDEIEEWDFLDGRVFAAVGSFGAEADPYTGYGWLCRLVDSGALAAAGFSRVRKPELQIAE